MSDPDTKEINGLLRLIRDVIRALPPGGERDALQARFDWLIRRLEQIPDRVIMQLRAGMLADPAELAAVYTTEWLQALDAFSLEAGAP